MDTPALEQLMGAYLHQDYRILGSWQDNVDIFVEESPDLAPLLPNEVEQALDAFRTDQVLAEHLKRLGLQARPPADMRYRDWLQEIARRVQAALARQH